MNDLRKAAEAALTAMDYMLKNGEWYQAQARADALRAALAQPEKEPVVWMYEYTNPLRERGLGFYETSDHEAVSVPLYAAPPQRKPLTEDEISEIAMSCSFVSESDTYFARAIEKAHGIGGEE